MATQLTPEMVAEMNGKDRLYWVHRDPQLVQARREIMLEVLRKVRHGS